MSLSITLALLLPQITPAPPLQEADAFDLRFTPEVRVVRDVSPAVVSIDTDIVRAVGPFLQQSRGAGSGVVIYDDGYIVTNYHVVEGANAIRVRFDPLLDDRVYEADLISAVPTADLALIKVSRTDPFPTVRLGTSSDLMVGERVLAIGNPWGESHTVSAGIISGLHRTVSTEKGVFSDMIQTDASINRGNSGGPLLNILGELIGINSAMISGAENIGFSIPVNTVRRVLEEHLLNLDAARGWLGYDLDLDTLTVTSIVPGGPAATAGMQTGDRIASIDGRPTEDAAGYRLARIAVWPGRTAELVVRRGADSRALQVEPWNQGNGILFDRLGLTVEALVIDRMRRRVVRVASLRPDGPAAQVGLLTGDIIDAVQPEDRRTQIVGSPEEFALVVQRFQAGTRLMVDIWRDENQNNRLERTDTYSELFNGYLTLQ